MIGTVPALRAEVVRSRGSAAALLPLIGLVVAAISTAGVFVTPHSGEQAALYWHALYVTGMAAPLMSLLAGLTTVRESAAREGGTPWRPVSPRLVVCARFLNLAGLSAVFHALAFWSVIPLTRVLGVQVDTAGLLWAGAGCWIATLGILAVAFVACERWGMVPVFLAAWVWQVLGTLTAEAGTWVFIPPAWAVRAMLPLLGSHQNAVPLDPADPLAHESPAPALALGVGLMILTLCLRLFVRAPLRVDLRTDARPIGRRSTRPGVLGALSAAMRGRPVLPLCLAALALCTAIALIYPVNYLMGLHTYVLLPLGACVVAGLLWQTLAPGWRLFMLRSTNAPAAVHTWLVACVSSVTFVVTVLALVNTLLRGGAGSDPDAIMQVLGTGLLWLILGAAVALGSLWLTVRYGLGWALGAVVILTVTGVTIGGDVLSGTWLWVLGPTAWPLSADTPGRFALAAGVGLLAAAAVWVLSRKALRNAPSRAEW